MVKPIFLIGIPDAGEKQVNDISMKIQKKMEDYHVICYNLQGNEPQFRVIYEKDFEEKTFEELKQIVRDAMK